MRPAKQPAPKERHDARSDEATDGKRLASDEDAQEPVKTQRGRHSIRGLKSTLA